MNGKKVPQEKIDNIIEAISLAPTSSGLQPFEVIVITNQEVKEKIRPISWNQSVVTDCSHLFVFAAWDTYTADRINKMFDLTNTIRDMKNEGWENYRQMLLNSYPRMLKKTLTMPLNRRTLHLHKQLLLLLSKKLTLRL
jgi:nitroreductase